ncbi:MAG: type II toxin-antitoxin system ParD family antitoxin [Alphaproteobacteria bacterium]
MASMHVSLPEQMKRWVEGQIGSGKYHNASEYFRDLIRRDQEAQERFRAVRAHLAEGAGDIEAGRFETLPDERAVGEFFDGLKRQRK